MPTTRKILVRTLKLLLVFYLLICAVLYFFQEKFIFFPDKLDKSYKFSFREPFDEVNVETIDGNVINALWFKSAGGKDLVFYLHGNAGSLNNWGNVAKRYTDLGYDIFILDYPGYGKSSGSIKSQGQLFQDIQTTYNEMKKKYKEKDIVILGYLIGTALAAKLASANQPRLLILQAPYYSLTDVMRRTYPLIPAFLLKYKLQTHKYLKGCMMPIVIFHGNRDEVIPYNSSIKLREEMKAGDTLITLHGQGHNGVTDNPEYIAAIRRILD